LAEVDRGLPDALKVVADRRIGVKVILDLGADLIPWLAFEAGEEGEIKINGVSFRVKCGEIRDDGVSVLVNGQPQKLTLPK